VKREIQAQAKSLFEGKRGPQPVSAESAPDRLYGEIGQLNMELDRLKKIRDQPAMIRHGCIGVHADLTQKRQCVLADVWRTTVYANQAQDSGVFKKFPVALRSSGTEFEEVRVESEPAIPIAKTGAAPSSCEKSSTT
jgi:hypothetical protein